MKSITHLMLRSALGEAGGGSRSTHAADAAHWFIQGSVIAGAAVDVDRLAGDEAAIVADQEEAGRGDLVDLALAPQGDAGRAGRAALIPFGVVAPGIDAAGRDDVDPDVVLGEFGGERAGHPDKA